MSKPGARILIVDDELEILRILRRSLSAQGYRVYSVSTGREALGAMRRYQPDLVLLDLGLPDLSGLEVCQRLRAEYQVPILILSVQDNERDKVQALERGADDYITKPFGIQEVLARVRVALRHLTRLQAGSGTQTSFRSGPLEVDLAQRLVCLNGQPVQLTPTEYTLLKTFITHRDKILTRQDLLRLLWGEDAQSRLHSLHVYIAQLRRKIEMAPEQPHTICTVPGIGYRFVGEEEELIGTMRNSAE